MIDRQVRAATSFLQRFLRLAPRNRAERTCIPGQLACLKKKSGMILVSVSSRTRPRSVAARPGLTELRR